MEWWFDCTHHRRNPDRTTPLANLKTIRIACALPTRAFKPATDFMTPCASLCQGAHLYDSVRNFLGILTYSPADVADGSQQLHDLRYSANRLETVTRFAPPIGPLLPGAGNILRFGFEPEIL